jgi:GPI mannosyltransferase 2
MSHLKGNMMILVYAFGSRIVVLALWLLSSYFLPKHIPSGVTDYVFTTTTIGSDVSPLLKSFTYWDAAHYLNLAKSSRWIDAYTYEESLPFFPLFPRLIHSLSSSILTILPSSNQLDVDRISILSGLLISNLSFIIAAPILYHLLKKMGSSKSSAEISVICFCIFNPGSVFFSAIYTESLFAMLSWCGFLWIDSCCLFGIEWATKFNSLSSSSSSRSSITTLFFSVLKSFLGLFMLFLASLSRVNGLLNSIPAFLLCCRCLILGGVKEKKEEDITKSKKKKWLVRLVKIWSFAWGAISAVVIFLPYFIHQSHITKVLLNFYSEIDSDEILSSSDNIAYDGSDAYSFVQRKHFNAGFLQQYEFKQLPNFMLAVPIVILSYYAIKEHTYINDGILWVRRVKDAQSYVFLSNVEEHTKYSASVFAIHLILTLFVGILFAHVQILTRLVCASSPLIYWLLASKIKHEITVAIQHLRNRDTNSFNSMQGIITFLKNLPIALYTTMFTVLGTILHSNNFPWT